MAKDMKSTLTKLKKKLDTVFSIWIRTRDDGRCFTCGKQGEIKEMQAGHYVSRKHLSLRWDERNVNCQCAGCNIFKHGALDVYALMLLDIHGKEVLRELAQTKKESKRFTTKELESLIKKYEMPFRA